MDTPMSLGGFATLTNVGAAYDTIPAARGLGVALIDFTGITEIEFRVGCNKVGTGTQSWQLWNETDGIEIGVIDDAGAAGNKILSATLTADIPTGVKLVRVRIKSTTAADDPVYYGAALLLKRPSPSFERCGFIEQLIRNVYGLIRDMRDNANGYKSRVIAGHPINVIAETMVADADQYLVRISWVTDAVVRNQTLVSNALNDMGLTLGQANALKNNLQDVANHTKAAALTTGPEINTEADYILANVPNYERLW